MKLHENQKVKIVSGGEATVLSTLGQGGQGMVYKVEYYGKEYALKWYYKPGTQEFYNNLKNNINKGAPDAQFLWPLYLTERDTEGCFGYIMELCDPAYRDFSEFLLAKTQFASVQAMVEAGINICIGFQKLHNKGYSYQDLNDGNFFINPQDGDVLICDNDNVAPFGQNTGILGKCRYMAPEVVTGKNRPNAQSDRFSLSVILFLLFFNNHPLEGERVSSCACLTERNEKNLYGINPVFIYDPNDDSNRPVPGIHVNVIQLWNQFPEYVRKIFINEFGKNALHNPGFRITEKEWLNNVLLRMRHDLIKCPNCDSEFFINTQETTHQCADCKNNFQRIPILHSGSHRIAPCKGKKIFQYVTNAKNPVLDVVTGIIVESKNTPGLFALRNLTGNTWILTTKSGTTRAINPNEPAPLLIGNSISFGNGTTATVE